MRVQRYRQGVMQDENQSRQQGQPTAVGQLPVVTLNSSSHRCYVFTRRPQQTLSAGKYFTNLCTVLFFWPVTTTFFCCSTEDTQSNADMRAARLRKAEQEREEEAAWFMQQVRVYRHSGADR